MFSPKSGKRLINEKLGYCNKSIITSNPNIRGTKNPLVLQMLFIPPFAQTIIDKAKGIARKRYGERGKASNLKK